MKLATERPYYWVFALLALVGLVADQASKYVVFAKLYPVDLEHYHTPYDVIPGCFALSTDYTVHHFSENEWYSPLRTLSGPRIPHVNKGALFGIGNDGESGMNVVFAIISVLAAGFIVVWASRPLVAQDRFLSIALGLILGGTLGNLYDRIVFNGVRDFVLWYYDTHKWPTFNIADCCLVCGASVLLVHSFLVGEQNGQATPTESAAQSAAPLQPTAPANGV